MLKPTEGTRTAARWSRREPILRTESDAKRDGWLTAKAGFTVLRFANEAVLRSPAVVFEAVRRHAARQA